MNSRAASGDPRQVAEWYVVTVVGLVGLVLWSIYLLASRVQMLGDPDIWWHIKTGEWMVQHTALPVTDPYSFSFAGKPWFAKEWLSQLLYFLAFAAAGWNGVMVLTLAVVLLAAWLLYRSAAEDLAPLLALALAILGLFIAAPTLIARPHILSLPLLVLWSSLLLRTSWQGHTPKFRWLAIIVIWANLHAGFTMAFVIAGFAFLDLVERHGANWRKLAPRWLVFLLLCPLASMVHPYGAQPLLASWWAVFPAEKALLLSEWAPFTAPDQPAIEGGLLLLLLMALASGFRLGWARALLLVLLLHLALLHVRFLFYLAPVLAVTVAPEIARQFPARSAAAWRAMSRDPFEALIMRHHRMAAAGAVCVLVSLAILAVMLPAAPANKDSLDQALAAVRKHGLTGQVLNDYNFGGPLIFSGIPTFIDGRSDQLFRADGFSLKYAQGPTDPAELMAALHHFGIGWTILRPSDPRVAVLDRLPGWERLFADKNVVVHVPAPPLSRLVP